MADKQQSSQDRARTRAIRARMATTGGPWSVAARHHDAEHARTDTNTDPETAERDWSLKARVRITADAGSHAPNDPWPSGGRAFRAGDELVLIQWGLAGRSRPRRLVNLVRHRHGLTVLALPDVSQQ